MRVLITGAARAIGAATAAELTERGHEVIATSRDASLLEAVPATQRHSLDVRDEQSIRAVIEIAGELDAVVNNAGLAGRGPLENMPIEWISDVLDTNVLGALRVVQSVAGTWRRRGSGVIVNVSSVQGRIATPLAGAYSASKFALEAISEALHYELSHFGIRTVIIEPGYIAPGMKPGDAHQGPPEYELLRQQWEGADATLVGPGGRPGPEIVGRAIAQAIEDPETPLRVPVGADAETVLAARASMTDAEFEATMRQVLDLTW
jgi:NAD(P)-dependent dehydrogenase (short-subunit alcohol dehydrogenase family)